MAERDDRQGKSGGAARIAVLMTCHNRRALTLRCLASLARQPEFAAGDLYLVDDGSSDWTGDAVREVYPQANVIEGDGSLFWNGGMNRAWEHAASSPQGYDYYLWLNDDVVLATGALGSLLADAETAAGEDGRVICAGATLDPEDAGVVTYGGHVRRKPARKPLRMRLVAPSGEVQGIDTISGNVVLVSHAAFDELGTLDPLFEHIYGDLDYGLRAREAMIPVVLGRHASGTCEANSMTGSSLDPAKSKLARIRARWREDKKVHARDWRRFVARYGGGRLRRFAYRLSPYLRILAGRPHSHSGTIAAGESSN